MEGKTSTSNEGSRINREKSSTISHNGRTFTEAKSRNVSDRKMEEILKSKGFENFDLNVLAVSFIDNVKSIGGDDNEIAETNSFATYEFDLSQIQVNWVPLKSIPVEKKEKIDKRRDREKAKRTKAREEREAREAEEMEAIKRRKEMEENDTEK